jgi:hypothetical protein
MKGDFTGPGRPAKFSPVLVRGADPLDEIDKPQGRHCVKYLGVGALVAGLLVGLYGCASQEPLPINLSLRPSTETVDDAAKSRVTVLVMPFGDDRSDRTKLGVHKTAWGSSEPVTLRLGTVGDVTARAFADFLERQGWRVQYVRSGEPLSDGEILISGKVLESSVDAHGRLGGTDIVAKHKIVVHAKNQGDGSSITHTVSHNGTYTVFWFSPEDAEEILSEVMERNLDKFVSQTKLEGSALRFK